MSEIVIPSRKGYTVIKNGLLPDGLSARAWGIYAYLLSRPEGWVCRPRQLVKVFKEGRDALYAAVNELCEHGLLIKEMYRDEKGMPRFRYVMPDPENPTNVAAEPNPDFQEPANQDYNHYSSLTITEVNQESAPEADAFNAFWDAYPRKTAKGAARKAWPAAVKKVGAERLVGAAVTFSSSVRGSDPKFIPHPSTWLNQERWDDAGVTTDAQSVVPDPNAWMRRRAVTA